MTAEEILAKHSKNYGAIEGNPRAIVKALEAIEAMKEYGKLLLEEYTNRIFEDIEYEDIGEVGGDGIYYPYNVVKKESITSQLPKFLKEKGYE